MENAEEIFHFLEDFSKRKPKTIPQELNEYLAYVARTGDPVYQWSLVKSLFKEKLLAVITDFYETTPGIDIPPYPNVDPFNYDIMKNSLIERLDSFTSAPFTVQRICELLTYPRKQYNRVDKFMRAVEKNILVVSTREPGAQRHPEPENGEPNEPIVNGSDNNSEYNVDVEMEDMSWKENAEQQQNAEPQPGSSEFHISVDDIEARLKAKQEAPMETQDKKANQYESVTPPEPNVTVTVDPPIELKTNAEKSPQATTSTAEDPIKVETVTSSKSTEDTKVANIKIDVAPAPTIIIPEIRVDDAEMTEQRLSEQSVSVEKSDEIKKPIENEPTNVEEKPSVPQPGPIDENSSDSSSKEDTEIKLISEVSTSSEESSSSSDNTDGNSNSPKPDERHIDGQEESSHSDTNPEDILKPSDIPQESNPELDIIKETPNVTLQSDDYSITDVNSELPQPAVEATIKTQEATPEKEKEETLPEKEISETKEEETETSTEVKAS